jgi:hypothetical protein
MSPPKAKPETPIKTAEPEELPALELRRLRDLDVADTDGGGERQIHAASGVVRRGDFAYVIGDDELDLGVFSISSPEPGQLRRVLEGDLPEGEEARKAEKADLEALAVLPPFAGAPYGALIGLGSGSASEGKRDRGFFWAFASDGSLAGEPHTIDLGPLYDLLRERIEHLNIEGASVLGDRLWLLHRGNREGSSNAIAELDLRDVMESLGSDWRIDVSELRAVREYDLGEFDGTPLCFSDATPVADQLVVFTAAAEVDGGPDDGRIKGSVVGTVDAKGNIERLRTIDPQWKVEGVHAAVDTGVIDFVFVCDQDDPGAPSPLLSATMPIDSAVEAAA